MCEAITIDGKYVRRYILGELEGTRCYNRCYIGYITVSLTTSDNIKRPELLKTTRVRSETSPWTIISFFFSQGHLFEGGGGGVGRGEGG